MPEIQAPPGASPAGAPGVGPPGQSPPMGSSPATQPTPNRGYEAAAQQGLAVAIRMLEQLLPLYGSASEQGTAVLGALKMLSKHAPPGAVSPAGMRNQLDKQQMANTQNAQLIQRMGGGGAGGGAAGAAAGGMPGAGAA